MSDAPFVQAARAETGIRDWNNLRAAIRGRADHEEIERLWDKYERWTIRADLPPTLAQVRAMPEVAALIAIAEEKACHCWEGFCAEGREDRNCGYAASAALRRIKGETE